MPPDLLLSLGDPAGIGPEITQKALSLLPKNARGRFLVVGNGRFAKDFPGSFEASDDFDFRPGTESARSGASALVALDRAIGLLKTGAYKGLVTAPLSKRAVTLAGAEGFHGHTDYLGEAFGCRPEMAFYSPRWSVLLATVHVPLGDVPRLLTAQRLEEAVEAAWSFQQRAYGGQPLALGVCGLNPHGGEGGLMGSEEADIFMPVLEKLRAKGILADGPLAGDTAFLLAEGGRYRMLVSPYHDQALAPFKLLHFKDGVNVSVGLPFLRCSPDHGTAFDIAGKDCADPQPMLHALHFALKNSSEY